MGKNSKIEWLNGGNSWSPWYGCEKVSPGCLNCYAEGWAKRFGLNCWGPGRERILNKDWQEPVRWNHRAGKTGERVRVFPSLCDPFDQEVAEQTRERFMRLVSQTSMLDWLLLTKRANVLSKPGSLNLFPSNAWMGVSIESTEYQSRAKWLTLANAAHRWISAEPLLGPLNLREVLATGKIDWVVVGGESGPKARLCYVEWVWDIVLQCRRAGVPVFVKQLGTNCVTANLNALEWPEGTRFGDEVELPEAFAMARVRLKHSKGGDPLEWPVELRVQEYPDPLKQP